MRKVLQRKKNSKRRQKRDSSKSNNREMQVIEAVDKETETVVIEVDEITTTKEEVATMIATTRETEGVTTVKGQITTVETNRNPTKNSHTKRRIKMTSNMDGVMVAKRSAITKRMMDQESRTILPREK